MTSVARASSSSKLLNGEGLEVSRLSSHCSSDLRSHFHSWTVPPCNSRDTVWRLLCFFPSESDPGMRVCIPNPNLIPPLWLYLYQCGCHTRSCFFIWNKKQLVCPHLSLLLSSDSKGCWILFLSLPCLQYLYLACSGQDHLINNYL